MKYDYIYRIENDKGQGCYRTLSLSYKPGFRHLGRKPGPIQDFGIEREPFTYEFCGFKSLKQLLNWFYPADLIFLERRGFKVKRVKGRITAQGLEQVLFMRKEYFDNMFKGGKPSTAGPEPSI